MLEVEVLFIFVMVAVLSSMSQKQFMIQSAVSSCVVGCIECKSCWLCSESECSKTGDFILDLYWSGCRGDWPSANT